MRKQNNYISTNRSKHYLTCHLIFVCKYRKSLLVGQLNTDMIATLQSIADKTDFEIEIMETDKDHVHFLIRYIPRLSISSMVRKLKQESTFAIWQKHKMILSKNLWAEKTFWSDGYFVCSIGEASPDTVAEYIRSQG